MSMRGSAWILLWHYGTSHRVCCSLHDDENGYKRWPLVLVGTDDVSWCSFLLLVAGVRALVPQLAPIWLAVIAAATLHLQSVPPLERGPSGAGFLWRFEPVGVGHLQG